MIHRLTRRALVLALMLALVTACDAPRTVEIAPDRVSGQSPGELISQERAISLALAEANRTPFEAREFQDLHGYLLTVEAAKGKFDVSDILANESSDALVWVVQFESDFVLAGGPMRQAGALASPVSFMGTCTVVLDAKAGGSLGLRIRPHASP